MSATSATDAWAVGYYSTPGPGAEFQTLILHWDGTSWTRVASPEPPNSSLSKVSALSPTDAWAIGGAGGTQRLVLHWDGTSWTQVVIPHASSISLDNVTAVSPTDVWAVGSYSPGPGQQAALALHWNGTTWAQVPSPDPGGRNGSYLYAVAATSPASAWAVGLYLNNNTTNFNLILRWNGKSWTQS